MFTINCRNRKRGVHVQHNIGAWHSRVKGNNDDYYRFIAYCAPGTARNASRCDSFNPCNNQCSRCSHLHFQWQKTFFPPLYCFMLFVCLFETKFSCRLQLKDQWQKDQWGANITRLSLQHVLCLYGCYFGNGGEHMRTVDRGPLHAVPVVNLPFPSLFVYVKLVRTKHRHMYICVHWFFHTSKTKSHIFHIVFPKSRGKCYAHTKVMAIFI